MPEPPQARLRGPITAPVHLWYTSPAPAQAKELPLHLIQVILSHLDDVADLARITRTSRLFYYMTLPRLYEKVTLHSYAEIRYVQGRPEGYGGGSPFALGLNTLVSRTFTDYVRTFRVVGEWREHDVDDYKQGRVPDNSMMLQIAMRAALDKMKKLESFAWELNTKPLQTIYQGLVNQATSLTSFTLRCQTRRIPCPTTIISPLPNLKTLVVYDIDPLCYPDDISLLLFSASKLENLKLHWNPRMRDAGEESVNLMTIFSRLIASKRALPVKRLAIYNLYTRFHGDGFDDVLDPSVQEEMTIINSLGSSDPMTVFLDEAWRTSNAHPVPHNLKMIRTDHTEKDQAVMLGKFKGLERMYIVSKRKGNASSKSNSTAQTPTSPNACTPATQTNGNTSSTSNQHTPTSAITPDQCLEIGSSYLAVIQTNHRTLRHLLLSTHWQLSPSALSSLCLSCPSLEQLGFYAGFQALDSFRPIVTALPHLWALRVLLRPGSEFAKKVETMDVEMHAFALATEMWRPEYRNLRYVGLGDEIVLKLGGVVVPRGGGGGEEGEGNSLNKLRRGPFRMIEVVSRESVAWVEIWGLDCTDFEVGFP